MAPALEGILETALYVGDLDAAEAFYGGILGLAKITRAGNRHVFYRCGPGVLLIFNPAETLKPPIPHGTSGQGHMCFRVSAAALDAWKAKLEAAGIAIEADTRWPNGARSFYFRDPAGNSLECAEPGLWSIE
ncbi:MULTISPECIES: VOC family protein [Ensifer]|uniref:VOC family protein n=1 Tax=Ensifer adhaerens TaxID=106592 RepID=A0ABY8HGD9_ENSAD|nr:MULTISPECIES: VOC family protein [Ensifer]KSV68695.1 bleomycin resistance protein [Sinorhizobium sp. GW3]KSV82599.1 bleomycin resistance protein [Sinorhizobium sp. GL2]OWZ94906.1 glyoxalase/bleomycin resistance/extradiol dioxygenase family protein [Sinorhizobium sp. LM21]ANK71159.1 bleomycin resistance protein [Ensifer adhaerens]KDP73936.1 bleomycin resistance protein [Ensifer adhaerens]